MPLFFVSIIKSNLFKTVEESFAIQGSDFSKVVFFMSDTTNVMKRVWSAVQKLIKDRNALCMTLFTFVVLLTLQIQHMSFAC